MPGKPGRNLHENGIFNWTLASLEDGGNVRTTLFRNIGFLPENRLMEPQDVLEYEIDE